MFATLEFPLLAGVPPHTQIVRRSGNAVLPAKDSGACQPQRKISLPKRSLTSKPGRISGGTPPGLTLLGVGVGQNGVSVELCAFGKRSRKEWSSHYRSREQSMNVLSQWRRKSGRWHVAFASCRPRPLSGNLSAHKSSMFTQPELDRRLNQCVLRTWKKF